MMKVIAKIHTDFPTKFGIPRQSGLVAGLEAQIVFEPEFRNPDAVRGMEGFSHLWLIWEFSQAKRDNWSATVRPPRLGGNTRVGVFATRSPFRPNPIGLSVVKLERIEIHPEKGPILYVSGADLMDQTPIYDIKPYLPYVDAHPEARGGFGAEQLGKKLDVIYECEVSPELEPRITAVLEQDPRPAYQEDPERVYGFPFADVEIHFRVEAGTAHVVGIDPKKA